VCGVESYVPRTPRPWGSGDRGFEAAGCLLPRPLALMTAARSGCNDATATGIFASVAVHGLRGCTTCASLALAVSCLVSCVGADLSLAEASSASQVKAEVDDAAKQAKVVVQLMRVENQVLRNDTQAAPRDAPVVVKAERVDVMITSRASVIVADAALLDAAKSLSGPGALKLADTQALRVESAVGKMSRDAASLKRDDAPLRSSVWAALALDVSRAAGTVIRNIQATITRPIRPGLR